MHAYSEIYVNDAMTSLGEAVDYAVYSCNLSAGEFMNRMMACKWCERFENGVPGVVAGMSGTELCMAVVRDTGGIPENGEKECFPPPACREKPSEEYWCGWILAYCQWRLDKRFQYILERLPMERILALYSPWHEASEDCFADHLEEFFDKSPLPASLARIRKASGLSQAELARRSGVNIRNIQQYEQRINDIHHAQYNQLLALAKVLGCHVHALLD